MPGSSPSSAGSLSGGLRQLRLATGERGEDRILVFTLFFAGASRRVMED
ncbi:MAG: hypothetical protein ABI479_05275 [Gallionella sp.]